MRERQIGVDLGGTTFTVGLVDTEGRIERMHEHETLAEQGPASVMERIAQGIRDLLAEAALSADSLRGIGLGMPGLHDIERGVCIYASNLRWDNVPVKEPFEAWFGVPVTLENDVRCAALGERHFGAGRDIDDMVLVTLGTGVGGALIMGGRLQRGGSGFAGEVGHQTISADGHLCGCGNTGCLEAYAGVRGIVQRAQAAYGRHKSEWLESVAGKQLEGLTPGLLYEAAMQGDETAQWVFAETGRYLGIGLSNVVSVLNPKRIIVGGGVGRAGELILAPLREEILRRAPLVMAESVEIVPAELGHTAGVVGASTLAWSSVA